jgi:urease accessory protein
MTALVAGLLHPLLVPMHLTAIVALALLIGQQMPRWGHNPAFGFEVVLTAGLLAIALAYVPGRAQEALLTAIAAAGLLVALARPLPELFGTVLGAAIGLSLALDSPPDALNLRDANLTLLGTALGAPLLLFCVLQVASRLRSHWQRIGARIVGSWIAASAVLVLALRLLR